MSDSQSPIPPYLYIGSDGMGKNNSTSTYPVHAKETSGLVKRCEPIMTPELFRSRFLLGVPRQLPNGDTISDNILKDYLVRATNEVELLTNMTVNREQFQDKLIFDRNLYKAWVHLKAEKGPIISLEKLSITSANGVDIFILPPDWIETANFAKRTINVIPLLAAYGSNEVSGSGVGPGGGGLAFLSTLDGIQSVPAYWQITYTAGMSSKEGQVPVVVNDLIGAVAAIKLLSMIAATNLYNSQSLSQDGISQSSSGPGPNIYKTRILELSADRDVAIKKLKGIFFGKFFVGEI